MVAAADPTLLSPAALSRLRWRCRRGLLENDLLLDRFFTRYQGSLTEAQAAGLEALMDLSDPDLLDLLLARREPEGALEAHPQVRPVLDQLRGPARA